VFSRVCKLIATVLFLVTASTAGSWASEELVDVRSFCDGRTRNGGIGSVWLGLNEASLDPTAAQTLMAVAGDLFRPPEGISTGTSPPAACVRPLPAVPGSFFMALTGFVTVLAARNRRRCTAALVTVLYLLQPAINAPAKSRSAFARGTGAAEHHTNKHFHLANLKRFSVFCGAFTPCVTPDTLDSLPAIVSQSYCPARPSGYSTVIAEQAVRLSPAIICANMSRGPPKPVAI
jgi:hypothetical protein